MSDSPFHPGTHIQFAWDSTSLGWLKECPRKYYYSMIEGYRSKHGNDNLTFGIHYHKALETYDKLKAEGIDHEEAVADAVLLALRNSYGWQSTHTTKNRYTLIRSIVWYLEEFRDDPAQTHTLQNGKAAVELSFRLELGGLLICGHLDRVVQFAGECYVADRKTTGSTIGPQYYKQFSPDNQMSLYTLAAQVIYKAPVKGVIIDAAQVAVGFTRFDRGFVSRTDEQLSEWVEDVKYWTGQAQWHADRGYWPMNDKSCFGCLFRSVCDKDPRVRRTFLEDDFVKQPWNPLEVR